MSPGQGTLCCLWTPRPRGSLRRAGSSSTTHRQRNGEAWNAGCSKCSRFPLCVCRCRLAACALPGAIPRRSEPCKRPHAGAASARLAAHRLRCQGPEPDYFPKYAFRLQPPQPLCQGLAAPGCAPQNGVHFVLLATSRQRERDARGIGGPGARTSRADGQVRRGRCMGSARSCRGPWRTPR